MRRFWVALVVAVLLSGSILALNATGHPKMLQQEQVKALAQLPEVRTISVDKDGVPDFIAGRLGYLPSPDVDGAIDYVHSLSAVFRCTGQEELEPRDSQADEFGQLHLRFSQSIRGIPVMGADLRLHIDGDTGEVLVINGRLAPHDAVTIPWNFLPPKQAFVTALREAGIHNGRMLDMPTMTYVLSPENKLYLAWETTFEYMSDRGPRIDRIFADVTTGDLVERVGIIKDALSRKMYTANNGTTLPGTLLFSEGGTSTDTTAVTAYNHAGTTYNYFKNKFNRDSFNNAGAVMTTSVHVGSNYVNAYWNGSQTAFGDGDNSQASSLAKDLDVVSHEWGHAVTDYTADMTYSNEPGALNEAYSDIWAASVSAYATGVVDSNTWKIGEVCWTPSTSGDALRYMNNPTADGQSYDYYPERYTGTSDYGGVHLNSGIGNLAYCLLVQGGTHPRSKTTTVVTGIGVAKAEQIFYRALTTYMTTSTNFQGARTATAQAATDLYGASSNEVTQVHNAWTAVGVPGAPVSVITLTNGQTVSGLGASTGTMLMYKIAVPSGQTSLVVTTSGGTGDADLYVKRGAQPTTSSYDARGYTSGNAETVTISNPVAGDFYIGVYAYATFASVSLKATYTGSTTTPDFSLAVSPSTLSVAQGASGTATATTTVSGGFNSAVALTASGVPSGATATFSPTSIAAPGSGTSTLTIAGGTATAGTYTVTLTGTGGGLTKTATLSLTITTGGGGNVLTNGVPVSNLSGSTGTMLMYTIAVPSGQTSLVVKTSGGTGDADLYVKRGAAPTTSSYDARGYTSGNAETVTISNPVAGTFYVGVYGYSAFSGVTLTATYSASSGTSMNETESNNTTATANTISTSGTTVTAKIGTSTDVDFFKVSLPAGKTLAVVMTPPSTKDYDIYIANSSGTVLVRGQNGTGAVESISYKNSGTTTATFYIKVYGYNSAYSSTLNYTCKATW
ncbi:MAG: peptidase M4 [Acidobacteria bacterium]|nr:peptidase M4 [Acidobacteriota bacterium]